MLNNIRQKFGWEFKAPVIVLSLGDIRYLWEDISTFLIVGFFSDDEEKPWWPTSKKLRAKGNWLLMTTIWLSLKSSVCLDYVAKMVVTFLYFYCYYCTTGAWLLCISPLTITTPLMMGKFPLINNFIWISVVVKGIAKRARFDSKYCIYLI